LELLHSQKCQMLKEVWEFFLNILGIMLCLFTPLVLYRFGKYTLLLFVTGYQHRHLL